MTHDPFLGDAVRVPCEKLLHPKTSEDVLECRAVSRAITLMSDVHADLLIPVDGSLPLVRVHYAVDGIADQPKPFWARHMSSQVDLEGGLAWRARISHIVLGRNEFFLTPPPDGTHDRLATDAVRACHAPRIERIVLQTVFTPFRRSRSFLLIPGLN